MAANQSITNPEEAYFNYFDDCQYYDLNSFYNYIDTNTPKSINIVHINIQSARKNLDEFLINLERTRTKFQVIILTLKCMNSFFRRFSGKAFFLRLFLPKGKAFFLPKKGFFRLPTHRRAERLFSSTDS